MTLLHGSQHTDREADSVRTRRGDRQSPASATVPKQVLQARTHTPHLAAGIDREAMADGGVGLALEP